MKIAEIFNFIINNYSTIIIIFGLLGLEISPIKFNPLSIIGKFIGKLLGVSELREQIMILKGRVDCNDIDTIRSRIVTFDNLCRIESSEIKYYQYKTCFEDIKKWKEYHREYPYLNGMIDIAIENIENRFKREKFTKQEKNH